MVGDELPRGTFVYSDNEATPEPESDSFIYEVRFTRQGETWRFR